MEHAGPTPTWIKIQGEYLGSEESQTQASTPAQDSSTREISPYNCWLQKLAGIELDEEATGALSNSSWRTPKWTHLLRLTPSEFRHWGGSLNGTSGIRENVWHQGEHFHCPFAYL